MIDINFKKYTEVLNKIFGKFLFSENIPTNENNTNQIDTSPCKIPFERLEIYPDGDIIPCCPDFLQEIFVAGNIELQEFDEIWNGKIFSELRNKLMKGDFSFCKRNICNSYTPYLQDKIPSDYKKGPKEIRITYDKECNYKCITCRDNIITNEPEKIDLYNNVYLPKILEAAENLECVSLSGAGDPLFSRHLKNLIKNLIKIRPNLKFTLFTNGFFLNEETLTELGIQNNIQGISVSLDAATRETYKKILRTDAFDRVVKNLEKMSEWKKNGKIEWLSINFVIHSLNYKEMPDFVKLAQRLDVNANFSTYRPWQSAKYHEQYEEAAVFEPFNKNYKEFVEILHNPIFKDKTHCFFEQKLSEIVYS